MVKPSGSENKIPNSETNSSNESNHQCKICNNNLKNINNLKNYEEKFHSQQEKCTFCARNFENSKILETNITEVHNKVDTKDTLERDPSLANHKQKKV